MPLYCTVGKRTVAKSRTDISQLPSPFSSLASRLNSWRRPLPQSTGRITHTNAAIHAYTHSHERTNTRERNHRELICARRRYAIRSMSCCCAAVGPAAAASSSAWSSDCSVRPATRTEVSPRIACRPTASTCSSSGIA